MVPQPRHHPRGHLDSCRTSTPPALVRHGSWCAAFECTEAWLAAPSPPRARRRPNITPPAAGIGDRRRRSGSVRRYYVVRVACKQLQCCRPSIDSGASLSEHACVGSVAVTVQPALRAGPAGAAPDARREAPRRRGAGRWPREAPRARSAPHNLCVRAHAAVAPAAVARVALGRRGGCCLP